MNATTPFAINRIPEITVDLMMSFKLKILAGLLLTMLLQPMLSWRTMEPQILCRKKSWFLHIAGYAPSELDTSLTILSARTIREAAVANFEELVPLVPNMNFSGEGSRARYFQSRGVSERKQYEGAPNPSVAYFIDDIDMSAIRGVAGLFDIAQVEVLKTRKALATEPVPWLEWCTCAAPTPRMNSVLTLKSMQRCIPVLQTLPSSGLALNINTDKVSGWEYNRLKQHLLVVYLLEFRSPGFSWAVDSGAGLLGSVSLVSEPTNLFSLESISKTNTLFT